MPARRNPRSAGPIVMIAAGLLLMIISGVWFFSRSGAAEPLAAEVTVSEISPADVPRVSISEAKTAYDAGEAVFVDVRDAASFGDSHIAGAVSIPLNELPDRINELNPEDWIITYCTWPAEETSARAAAILLNNGFGNVTPIRGGFQAWSDLGYPIEQ